MALGGATVAEMQRRMSSREFAEWLAYDRLEPLEPWRGDWRAAMLATVLASAFRGRGTRPFSIADFMPGFGMPAPARRDPAKLEQKLNAWAKLFTAAQQEETDGDHR